MVTLDGTNTGLVAGDYTSVVTWTDGTTTGTLTDTAAGDLAGTFTDLPAGKVPSRITITQNGGTQTYSFSSVTNCAPAIPAPTLHQTVVSGDGNDTYTLTHADGTAVPSSAITDNGWLQLGDTWKKRVTATTDGWFTGGTTVGNTVTYIMTDAGPSTTETKPIMGTRTEPVYTSRTTCTDPVVGTFQVDQ